MNQIVRSYIKTAFLTLSCISPITFAQHPSPPNFFDVETSFSNVGVTVTERIGGAAFYNGRLWFGIPRIGAYALTAGGEGWWGFADLGASSSVAMTPRLCNAIPAPALNAGICISHSRHSRYTPTVMSFTGAPTRISFTACPARFGKVNCEGFTVTPQPYLLFATPRRTFATPQKSNNEFGEAVESSSPPLEGNRGMTATFHYAYLINRDATGLTRLFKAHLKHNTPPKWKAEGVDLSTIASPIVDITSSVGSNQLYWATPNRIYYSQLDQDGTPSQPMALAMTGDVPSGIRKIAVPPGGRTMFVASANRLYQCYFNPSDAYCTGINPIGTSLTDIRDLAIARSAAGVGLFVAQNNEADYCVIADGEEICITAITSAPEPITSISTPTSYNALWGTANILVGLARAPINTQTTLFSCNASLVDGGGANFDDVCVPAVGDSEVRAPITALQLL